jgi:GNAT superfamily N-acetyltransferase
MLMPNYHQLMQLVELTNQEISDPEIQRREATSSRCAHTRHFLAEHAGSEVGFVSIDLLPSEERFVIYEIFVPSALRRRGIGGLVLEAVEEMARRMGYESTLLVPKSLDEAFEQRAIEEWYARRGYKPLENAANGSVVKQVARATTSVLSR